MIFILMAVKDCIIHENQVGVKITKIIVDGVAKLITREVK